MTAIQQLNRVKHITITKKKTGYFEITRPLVGQGCALPQYNERLRRKRTEYHFALLARFKVIFVLAVYTVLTLTKNENCQSE